MGEQGCFSKINFEGKMVFTVFGAYKLDIPQSLSLIEIYYLPPIIGRSALLLKIYYCIASIINLVTNLIIFGTISSRF